MYSIKDFKTITEFLDKYDINYTSGSYYNNDKIIGHWIEIDASLETDELTDEDIEYNDQDETNS